MKWIFCSRIQGYQRTPLITIVCLSCLITADKKSVTTLWHIIILEDLLG